MAKNVESNSSGILSERKRDLYLRRIFRRRWPDFFHRFPRFSQAARLQDFTLRFSLQFRGAREKSLYNVNTG